MSILPNETPTAVLIDRWVREHDEAAFSSLVKRYAGMVFATAMRATGGQRDLSNDVSQQVFVALAQKASGLARDERLGGWLHKRTCWTASKMLRSETRRHDREQAKAMCELKSSNPVEESPWDEWTLQLDAALQQLKKADREAITGIRSVARGSRNAPVLAGEISE